jgi:hypothetical protein
VPLLRRKNSLIQDFGHLGCADYASALARLRPNFSPRIRFSFLSWGLRFYFPLDRERHVLSFPFRSEESGDGKGVSARCVDASPCMGCRDSPREFLRLTASQDAPRRAATHLAVPMSTRSALARTGSHAPLLWLKSTSPPRRLKLRLNRKS